MIGYVTLGTNDLQEGRRTSTTRSAPKWGWDASCESDAFIAWGGRDGGAGFGVDPAL